MADTDSTTCLFMQCDVSDAAAAATLLMPFRHAAALQGAKLAKYGLPAPNIDQFERGAAGRACIYDEINTRDLWLLSDGGVLLALILSGLLEEQAEIARAVWDWHRRGRNELEITRDDLALADEIRAFAASR